MTLFTDLSGMSSVAFSNLFTISGDDGGLGVTDAPGDTTVFLVQYTETAGQPATADRLSALVNTDFGMPIVITAVNGGNDPYSGLDVTGNGFTYILDSVIRIVYDISQCCGQGIFVFDTGNNHISLPNPVILYHELSHAFRAGQGTTQTNDEPPAETDENVLRTQLGLCLRDVNNHGGGCGSGDNCGGSDGGPDGGPTAAGCAAGNDDGCFIVTATTGSPVSVELVGLRLLRDQISMMSPLADRLIESIYREYYQFSPDMALRLHHDEMARMAVLGLVVRPLLAWYSLAGTLALSHSDSDAIERASHDLVAACPRFPGTGSIVSILATIRAGGSLPLAAPRLLRDLTPRLRQAAGLPHVAWAILDPLARAWAVATRHADPVEQVAQWLADAPIETLTPPADPAALDGQLRGLARFYQFQPRARMQLGSRLAVAWPEARATLARHAYIDNEVHDGQTTDTRC
jgi:hypothetical protein